jgi:ABC-type nitrate/sulfonate/bicarbonate transport system permease component
VTTTELIEATVAIPPVTPVRRDESRALRYGRSLLALVVSLAVVLGFWQLFLIVFHIDHFVGKTPLDVWRFLTASSTAAAPQSLPTRGNLYPASLTTLKDAFVGLNLRRSVEQTLMPMAMVLRSVPLVAMTPLITLVFGRGLMGVTVIAGIVTFFPTLVNVTLALRSTPQASIDLFRAYGAGPVKTMRKVQLPNALPAIFASLRIAAPLALIGALLAEWLATGHGLGYLMLQSSSLSNYNMLWSTAALVTAYSMFLYASISGIEKRVLARFGDSPA